MAVHCQLLFATILYILVSCNSIISVATIANGKASLGGYCYLYAPSDSTTQSLACKILEYVYGGIIIYSMIMAIYHGFGTYTASRDNHIGRTMWVMPWLLMNSFLLFLTFVCSCVYTVGLYMTCHEIGKRFKNLISCTYDAKDFRIMLIAEISVWISVALWIFLVIIEGVRLRRNRRALAREVYVEPTTSDDVSIGNILPTA